MLAALRGGTFAMRAADENFLPRAEGESRLKYETRLASSFLFEAYDDTVGMIASQPFTKPVSLQGPDLPQRVSELWSNIDGRGMRMTDFASALFDDMVDRGLSHVFVDFPNTGGSQTEAQERQGGIRPYLVHVKAENMIGWRTRVANGQTILEQIRFRECTVEPDGDFGEMPVERVRVFNADGTWEVWKHVKAHKDKWVLENSGAHTFKGIPLVTVYSSRTGFMTASPPLEKIAWLNVEHWQSASDQRNILHHVRVPVFFRAGFTEEELAKDVVLGAGTGIGSTNPEATAKWIESQGSGVKVGADDLRTIEQRMEVLGAKPFMPTRTGSVTATARVIDEKKTHSSVQAWVRALEIGLRETLVIAGQWVGETLDDKTQVAVFNEFTLATRAADDNKTLIELYREKGIDRTTLLEEMKRRGVLSELVDPAQVSDAVLDELMQELGGDLGDSE